MAKPKADWSQFRSGGEAYPLQRSRGDGDDDAEAAAVAMERSRNGHWKEIPSRTTYRAIKSDIDLRVGEKKKYCLTYIENDIIIILVPETPIAVNEWKMKLSVRSESYRKLRIYRIEDILSRNALIYLICVPDKLKEQADRV